MSAKPKKLLSGLVKAVKSGDTLMLLHPKKLPPLEKQITLACINAPRMGRMSQQEEPFAFQSREFLRKLLIGRIVYFRIDYTNPKSGRDFGTVYLKNDPKDIESNVGYLLLSRGLANLRGRQSTDEFKLLEDAYENAKNRGIGMHTSNKDLILKNTRDVSLQEDLTKWVQPKQKKPVSCIVEHVLSGSTVRIQLPTHQVATLYMTAIQCPRIKFIYDEGKKTRKEVPEPLAPEAKHFTEVKLLHRDVMVLFEGIREEKNGQALIGTVVLDKKIKEIQKKLPRTHQEELLIRGFARYADYNAEGTIFQDNLKAAEQSAKAKKIRLWKDYVAPLTSLKTGDNLPFKGRVIEVISGDKLRIRRNGKKQTELVSLSCVKAPRISTQRTDPWGYEARDKLRKAVAGKVLKFKIDYRRPVRITKKGENGETITDEEERAFVTCTVNNKNVAMEILRSGLASVVFRRYDEERSADYTEMKQLEDEAKKKKKGIFGNPRNAPRHRFNDLTFKTLGEVERFTPVLCGKKFRAVIEKVYTATRYKIYLPKDHLKFVMSLSCIQGIKAQGDVHLEECASESLELAEKKLLLQDVNISIETVDKVGTFIGEVFVKKDNFSHELVREGFASVRKGTFAERHKSHALLSQIEREAQEQEKNVWKGHQERQEKLQKQQEEEDEEIQNYEPYTIHSQDNNSPVHSVRVTEVESATKVYMQTQDAADYLDKIGKLLKQLNLDAAQPLQNPKEGDACFANFSFDNEWYRAKIRSIKDKQAEIIYIDYGNTEYVALSKLRAMYKSDLIDKICQIPPQIKECKLAFVKDVPKAEYAEEAAYLLSEMTVDKDLFARLEYEDNKTKEQFITLFDGNHNLTEDMVRKGYLFVHEDPKLAKDYGQWMDEKIVNLHEANYMAKKKYAGAYENGDIYQGDSDDEN